MHSTALIIDIRKSRKMTADQRMKAQMLLKDCMQGLHPLFEPNLQYEMDFSGGDGVQGLFDSAASAYLYARLFLLLIYPIPVRCGLGFGSINVIMKNDKTNAQDGSAYHRARRCVNISGEETDRSIVFASDREYDFLINALLLSSSVLHSRHTSVQHGYQMLLELHSPLLLNERMKDKFGVLDPFILDQINENRKGKELLSFEKQYAYSPVILEDLNSSPLKISANKHGLAAAIAKTAGVRPQNVQNMLKRGASKQIRDIEAAAAVLLKEKYDENK